MSKEDLKKMSPAKQAKTDAQERKEKSKSDKAYMINLQKKRQKKLDQEIHEFDGITKRWEADAKSGSYLAVNVRPLTLVFFSLSYVVGWYLDYPLDNISGVLQLIVGAYFGSRGAEKVFGNKLHK